MVDQKADSEARTKGRFSKAHPQRPTSTNKPQWLDIPQPPKTVPPAGGYVQNIVCGDVSDSYHLSSEEGSEGRAAYGLRYD